MWVIWFGFFVFHYLILVQSGVSAKRRLNTQRTPKKTLKSRGSSWLCPSSRFLWTSVDFSGLARGSIVEHSITREQPLGWKTIVGAIVMLQVANKRQVRILDIFFPFSGSFSILAAAGSFKFRELPVPDPWNYGCAAPVWRTDGMQVREENEEHN